MIRFYFDYLSPYAYLASTQIRALGARHGHEVEAVPILFAALLDANGSKGPAEVPRRRAYIYKDVMRLAHALGQPIGVPATHPFNPLAPLRATCAVGDPIARWRLVDALYRATWVDGLRVDQPEVVARVAAEAGFDGLLQTAGIKERLRANTEEALAAGCFGVPSMIVDGELFFGCDSLPHLERFLRGEDPLTREALARWETLQPSATRRGTS